MPERRKQTLEAAGAFALGGAACAVPVVLFVSASSEGWWKLIPAASLAAAISGAACIRLLLVGKTSRRVLRGAVAGALAGALSHPLAWSLFMLGLRLVDPSFAADPGPDHWLSGIVIFTISSLVVAGWLTVPVGAALGARLARSPTAPP